MKVEVKNGELVLVRSDSILVYENEPVELTFDEQYTLTFRFSEDSTLKDNEINFEPLDVGVEFRLINFQNPLGTAIGKPIAFATADEKQVYLSFAVYSVGKAKILHYNIYTEQ